MSSSRGDYALEQEKFGLAQIEKANAEKENLLSIAKKIAKKDLESYDDEMRRECMNKITELTSNTEVIEEIQNKNKQEFQNFQNLIDILITLDAQGNIQELKQISEYEYLKLRKSNYQKILFYINKYKLLFKE